MTHDVRREKKKERGESKKQEAFARGTCFEEKVEKRIRRQKKERERENDMRVG